MRRDDRESQRDDRRQTINGRSKLGAVVTRKLPPVSAVVLLLVFVFVFVLVPFLALSGCGFERNKRYQGDFTGLFGTDGRFVYYAPNEAAFTAVFDMAYDELARLHELFDIYHDYEGIVNLKTVNDRAGIEPVAVGDEIIELLTLAKDAYAFTEQSVNITLGPVTAAWKNAADTPPDPALLADAGSLADMDKLRIDAENGTVFLTEPGMCLDVGAIAKGYAAQRTMALLNSQGVMSCLLDMGGNVVASGQPEPGIRTGSGAGNSTVSSAGNGTGSGAENSTANPGFWRVGVQNPDGGDYLSILPINDLAVVTSGDYQRGSHIIDPFTLAPADRFRAVTVVHEDSFMADVLSTALFILPQEKGRALADAYGAAVLWVLPDGTVITNTRYDALVPQSQS